MARPIDFSPPFGAIDAVGMPTDPPDERIDVGVRHRRRRARRSRVRDPARSAARGASRGPRAARRRSDRGAREGQAGRFAPAVRRGRQPVVAARALPRAPEDRRLPDLRRGAGRGRVRADAPLRVPDSSAADDAKPRQPRSLGLRAWPFSRRAGRGGRGGRPPRDRRHEAPGAARPRRQGSGRATVDAAARGRSSRRSRRATTSSPA